MDSAQRDAFLRMLLPAIGVVVVYTFALNKQAELTAAQAALASAQAAAVSPNELFPVQAELAAENAKQDELKKQKQVVDDRWARLTSLRTGNAAQRAASLRQLTRMLWDRGLVPYEESPHSGAAGQLPGSFDDVLRKLSPNATTSAPRLWEVRFYGRYRDVIDALSSLGDSDVALVPVGLTMSDAHPDTDWRMWTLLLWN